MSTLMLMIGTPASGKTTIRDKIISKIDATLICPDDMIGYTKENPWTPQAARNAWREADSLLKEVLKRGDNVIIFDATFVGAKKRSKYIRMTKKYNADIAALYCRCSFKTVLERNASRDPSRQVPYGIIKSMHGRLEPPEKGEGFKHILTFDTDANKLYDSTLLECLKIGGLNDR